MDINSIVLASGSPFRRALLTRAGVIFKAVAPDTDEDAVTGRDPGDLALNRALAKGLAVAASEQQALVIGGDQVLSCEGRMYRKAKTPEEAAARLRELSGKTHYLHAAFCLVARGAVGDPVVCHQEVIDVAMTMRPLTEPMIAAYIATGEWQGAVGCYQYENRGVQLFERVDGNDAAIIGLPLEPLFNAFRRLGFDFLLNSGGPWRLVNA